MTLYRLKVSPTTPRAFWLRADESFQFNTVRLEHWRKPRAFWLRADETFQFNIVLHAKSNYAKGVTVYGCSDF